MEEIFSLARSHLSKIERHPKPFSEGFGKIRIQPQDTEQIISVDLVQSAVSQSYDQPRH